MGIEDGRARSSLTALFFGAYLLAQSVVNLLPAPVEPPTAVVIVDRAPGRELVGDVPPLAAGPDEVEDGVDDTSRTFSPYVGDDQRAWLEGSRERWEPIGHH